MISVDKLKRPNVEDLMAHPKIGVINRDLKNKELIMNIKKKESEIIQKEDRLKAKEDLLEVEEKKIEERRLKL
jgi:hypothetical protein